LETNLDELNSTIHLKSNKHKAFSNKKPRLEKEGYLKTQNEIPLSENYAVYKKNTKAINLKNKK